MTTAASLASPSRPRVTTSLLALTGLLLRSQLTLARLLGIAGLGALSVLLGLLSRSDEQPADAAAEVVATYGLGIFLPLAALWLGTSVIGDLVEDRLLVYLWLKPLARWVLPAAAVLATFAVVAPLTALPLAATGLVAGSSDVALSALGAAALGGLAYTGISVAAGLWFRRAIWYGLAFVLLWENALAYAAEGSARYTVSEWARSILESADGVDVEGGARSAAAAFVVLPAVAIAGWLVATWRYGRADID